MNIVTVWQEFLSIVAQEVGSRVVETWFKALIFSSYDAATKTVYLKAPNAFIKDWVTAHYSELIKTHLGRLLHEQRISLIFLDGSKAELIATEGAVQQKFQPSRPARTKTPVKAHPAKRYEFDNLIVGPHNAMAVAAAQAVAKAPGGMYNPLYIYGGAGLGKTHLLHAVGNHIKSTNSKAKILYQSAERFVHEFISAVRFDKAGAFEQKYRDVDVLLIDDIQFISHKEQTQEAFFHIFNALYESGKQIVLSSDALPGDIDGLADRIRSRLDGALIADIQSPTAETKVEILHKKAEAQKYSLTDEVAQFIASKVTSNVRELEGLLIRVLAFATLTQQTLSLDLAHKVLVPAPLETRRVAPLDLPRIAHSVANYYHQSVTELRTSKRTKGLVLARHVAMYLMKKKTEQSLLDIAGYWCRKDHSTVIHACTKIETLRKSDAQFARELDTLEQSLQR